MRSKYLVVRKIIIERKISWFFPVEIKEELIKKFMQQDYVKKEYNEPFKHKLLSRFVNNLLEKWLELQDEAEQ